MNILSIGNSFSQNAHRYLHEIAKADDCALNTYNLYIGGCPLARHFRNMMSEERAYTLEMNGDNTFFRVGIKEALLTLDWDVVTLQQASNLSVCYDTYQPYLNKLAEYVRTYAPKAKLVIHQTWAYEQGSARLNELMRYAERKDMFSDLKAAYQKAAEDIGAAYIIPSGEAFEKMADNGFGKLYSDTAHAGHGLGEYVLGLTWYAALTGKKLDQNTFADFDEEISPEEMEAAKKYAYETALEYRNR